MTSFGVWGLLGDIEFTYDGQPHSFTHERSLSYAEHPIVLARPKQQYTGRSAETLKLSIKFSTDWCDPDAKVRELWAAADLHKPLRLVLGNGLYKKSYLIKTVSTRLKRTDAVGQTECIELDISLVEGQPQPAAKPPGEAVRKVGYAPFMRSRR